MLGGDLVAIAVDEACVQGTDQALVDRGIAVEPVGACQGFVAQQPAVHQPQLGERQSGLFGCRAADLVADDSGRSVSEQEVERSGRRVVGAVEARRDGTDPLPGSTEAGGDLRVETHLIRPELGLLPHSLGRGRIEKQFWSLFADRDLVDPNVADVAVDEFERIYRSAGARLAFLASARSIYLDQPFGRGGLFPRMAALEPPALFVWGSHDKLIPPGFGRHVERWLPSAEQIVLEGCGHVPQIERPERTNGLLTRFFARIDALGAAPVERVAA